jgi:hypothetical protein
MAKDNGCAAVGPSDCGCANVPVSHFFWSVTLRDHATCALILDVARPSIDSYDKKASKNADGSIDIYSGPKAPNGMEANLY